MKLKKIAFELSFLLLTVFKGFAGDWVKPHLVTGMRPYNFVAVFQSLRAGEGQKFDHRVDSFLHRIGLFVCCWQALVHDNWSYCCGLPDRALYFDSQKIGEVFRLVLFLWMSLWSKH